MLLPLPHFSQYECRDETLEVFASDRRGLVEYKINNLGYRNTIDYTEPTQPVGVYFGSSITTAIGVPMEQGFASSSARQLNTPCYQFGQGCMMVDNQESLRMLKAVLSSGVDIKYVVIQFINLNRRYSFDTGRAELVHDNMQNIKQFHDTFDEIEQLLKNRAWCFVGTDDADHDVGDRIINHSCCIKWNPRIIDLAGVGYHPGPKWHQMVAAGIVKNLQQQLS